MILHSSSIAASRKHVWGSGVMKGRGNDSDGYHWKSTEQTTIVTGYIEEFGRVSHVLGALLTAQITHILGRR
jgi:hypothetical protein